MFVLKYFDFCAMFVLVLVEFCAMFVLVGANQRCPDGNSKGLLGTADETTLSPLLRLLASTFAGFFSALPGLEVDTLPPRV